MARKIDTDAVINKVRLKQQFSHPSSPESGHNWLYVISGSAHGGLYLEDASGRQIGPFITGSASSGGGYAEGTSFPGSPSTNDKYYRTDRNLLYYYDGTRWLTTTLYAQVIESQRAVTPLSTNNFFESTVWTEDYDQYIVDFRATAYVVTTNNGSNYWDIKLMKLDGASAATLITTASTSAASANTWTRLKQTVGALLGTGMDGLEIAMEKTGGPGTMYVSAMVTYRLVG